MNSVLIVVLNWNGLADTEQCLESLQKLTYKNHTVLLIDNGSTEANTADKLRQLQIKYDKKMIILHNDHNEGFAGGVNTGIRYGIEHNFDYIALLNNDAIVESEWLTRLVAAAERQQSWLTTGLLLHSDGKTIDSTGDWCSIWGLPFPRSRGRLRAEAPDSGPIFGVSGGASLYKSDLFRDIGLFDETFFAYYEDADINFRAKLAGHTAHYEQKAVAYHKQGATSSTIPGFAVEQTMKNLPLLFIKNIPTSLLFTVGIRFWTAYLLIMAKAVLSPNVKSAFKGYFKGVWLFWTNAVPQRRHIQTHAKISSKQIKAELWPELPPDQTGLRRLFGQENT